MQAEIKTTAMTLAGLLLQISESFGDRPALISRSGLRDEVWSCAKLNRAAHNVARDLLGKYRLKPGDRLLVQGFNDPRLVAIYFGCLVAGVIVVPLDQFSSPDFIARIVALVEATAYITEHPIVQMPEVRHIHTNEFDLSASSGEWLDFSPKPDDIAEIIFTSGTTGQPKGVILTHQNILSSIKAIQNVYPQRPEVRFLSLLPLSHMFEQTVGLFAPLLNGAIIYYPDGRHSKAILRKLKMKHICGIIVVPQILELLLNSIETTIMSSGRGKVWRFWPKIGQYLPFNWRRFFTIRLFPQISSLPEFFVCGGAPLSLAVEQHLENIGIRVVQGYGATECSPVITINNFNKRIAGSVGWPAPGIRIKLSQNGEVLVQGENVTQGYWKNAEATHSAFTEDHYYRTADLGEIGKQGELYIKGRCKNTIVLSNGLNVFPEDIEPVLMAQPGIAACVVMALPDADGTPCITGILRLNQEDAESKEKESIAHEAVRLTNAKLMPHQRISTVRIWNGDFPRTSLMKVQRWKVQETLLKNQPKKLGTTPVTPELGQLATVEELLAEVCRIPVQSISAGTDMAFDLGLDSLARVELTVLIEQQLGVLIDDADLIGVRCVGDLKDLIKHSESVSAAARFPIWALSGAVCMARRLVQSAILFPLHSLISCSFTVTGIENLRNLPQSALFIANHSSHVDTISALRAMPPYIRSKLAIAAAADYFFRNKFLAGLIELTVNAFPFSREGSIRASLEYCGELMDNGWSVLIYPEGTRSANGELLNFKSGIGFLATGLNAPIVPIAIRGGYQILPKGAFWPKRGNVSVTFGEPVYISPNADKQEATKLLHETISRLLYAQDKTSSQTGA